MPMVSTASVRDSSNFSNFDNWVLNTFVMTKSLDVEKLAIGNKYSVGIKACNPYTNWKVVWLVLTLKAIL